MPALSPPRTFAGLIDVLLSGLADQDRATWIPAAGKWENRPDSSAGAMTSAGDLLIGSSGASDFAPTGTPIGNMQNLALAFDHNDATYAFEYPGNPPGKALWVGVELPAAVPLVRARVLANLTLPSGQPPYPIRLQCGTDGVSWEDVVVAGSPPSEWDITFAQKTAQFWRVLFHPGETESYTWARQVYSFELYDRPGNPIRLPIGSSGQALEVVGGAPAWATLPAGFVNPMTAQDDLIVGGTAGAPARLAKGSSGQVLTVDTGSGHLAWDAATGFANPMTTAADLIVGGTAGAPARLGKGADGQVLTVDPATHLLLWATPAAPGMTDPTTTKGDVIARGASAPATRLGVGSDGQVLTARAAATLGVDWESLPAASVINEVQAGALVNATSAGDAGARADHFTGAALSGAWTKVSTGAISSVANSSAAIAASGNITYARAYTPSGAFRIEARFQLTDPVGTGQQLSLGVFVVDSSFAHYIETHYQPNNATFWCNVNDGGTQNHITLPASIPVGVWCYLALSRDGSNNVKGWISFDRNTWLSVPASGTDNRAVTNLYFGLASSANGVQSIDFVDVVS